MSTAYATKVQGRHDDEADALALAQKLDKISVALKGFVQETDDHNEELKSQVLGIGSRVLELEQKAVRAGRYDGSGMSVDPFSSVFEHPGYKALLDGATNSGRIHIPGSVRDIHRKAVLLSGPAPDGLPVQAARLPFVGPREPRLTLFDLLPTVPITVGQVEFVQISFANNAAPQVEGQTKAEVTASTALRSAVAATIAGWMTASKQGMSDAPQAARLLGDAIRNQVLRRTHSLTIAGEGGADQISGLANEATLFVPTATTDVDAVSEAQATLDDAGYNAGIVLLNPLRWHRIRTTRADTGDGQYLAGSWNQPAAPNIWSVPVITDSAVGINEAIVLDPSVALLLDREQATVLISTEDRDNFIKNLVTILAEIRLGLAVTDKGGVLKFALPE